MATIYGHKLNPDREHRIGYGIKGIRSFERVSNNPSTISENEQLLVRFPNLGENDVIVPGTARLSFNLNLVPKEGDKDPNCTVVQNLGRNIVKKLTVKISSNEVLSIDDCDIYNTYMDLWLPLSERQNRIYQGIDHSENMNVTKLRMGSEEGDDSIVGEKAVANNLGNRFCIPLDFELLENNMPFCQSALGDRLEYEFTFNEFRNVVFGEPNMKYVISNITLEFEKVTDQELASNIRSRYSAIGIKFDRILRHRMMPVNMSDRIWNINLNVPAKSMKGILMLFKKPSLPFAKDTEDFYNPKIKSVEMIIEGVPNQLYSQKMLEYNLWDEVQKLPMKQNPMVNLFCKETNFSNMTIYQYLVDHFALWLDMRTTDDDQLHGSGRKIENASEGITIQITKEEETQGPLYAYIYVIMDAQINIRDGRFEQLIY